MEHVRLKLRAWWETLIGVPLIKASLSLMTGTIVTSGLGLVFWILAARLYEPSDLGVSSTAIYTMMMIADVACLGLRTGLVRFIPNAGLRTGRTIVWGYSLVVAASTIVAVGFLAGLSLWAPELAALRTTVLLAVFFTGSTVCWALFMLEDAVLVGLRRAPWVLVENTVFGLLKIVLLFPFASLAPDLGIFWAWTLPVFPIVIGVNLLMARLPEARRGQAGESGPAGESGRAVDDGPVAVDGLEADTTDLEEVSDRGLLRAIVSFSLADWFSAVARLLALGFIPLIVLARLGREFAAYFQVSWLIAFVIFSLSTNAAYALLAESSYEKAKLNRNSVQALGLSLALTVPVALVGLVGAGLLLRIYGTDYADNSANVLRILLVAAVPNVIHQLFIGRLRSQGRMLAVVTLEIVLSVLVLGLVWVLIPSFGLNGVGLAWLIGLSAMAAYAVANESLWWWADRLDTSLVRQASRAARRLRPDRASKGSTKRLDTVLASLGIGDGVGVGPTRWCSGDEHVERAVVDLTGERRLVVNFARSVTGGHDVVRTGRVLNELRADPALSPMISSLPVPVGTVDDGPESWTAWTEPAAATATVALASGVASDDVIATAVDAVAPLHRATALPVLVDDDQVDSWIGASLERLSAGGRAGQAQIDRLRDRLIGGFSGRVIDVGVVHGALITDNVLVDTTGRPTVAAVVGWQRSTTLPVIVDRATLALSDLTARTNTELGQLVARLLDDPADLVDHPAFSSSTAGFPGLERRPNEGEQRRSRGADIEPDSRSVLLLAWLQLVGAPVESSRAVAGDIFWLARNARPVLSQLELGPAAEYLGHGHDKVES
jgi:hypothetical protein